MSSLSWNVVLSLESCFFVNKNLTPSGQRYKEKAEIIIKTKQNHWMIQLHYINVKGTLYLSHIGVQRTRYDNNNMSTTTFLTYIQFISLLHECKHWLMVCLLREAIRSTQSYLNDQTVDSTMIMDMIKIFKLGCCNG